MNNERLLGDVLGLNLGHAAITVPAGPDRRGAARDAGLRVIVRLEVNLAPHQGAGAVAFGAPAIGERVDEEQTAAGHSGGWPGDVGEREALSGSAHLDAHAIPMQADLKPYSISHRKPRMPKAVGYQFGGQQAKVERRLSLLVQG